MQADFKLQTQYTARQTDDYIVDFDEYRRPTDDAQMMIAHIRMLRWSPSVLKRMRREWALFRTVCRADIYAYPKDDTPLWRKFIEAVGFTYFKHINCTDGVSRPLYISRVTNALIPNYTIQLVEPAGVCPAGR